MIRSPICSLAMIALVKDANGADQLRRAMGAWRKRGGLTEIGERLMEGMRKNGITPEYAEQIFKQIQGFAEYGFPESHAASFAHLVYVSSWLRCHYPAAFTAALVNSQPMGFYAPAQIVRDAREHGVQVRGIDVLVSAWDCDVEAAGRDVALRLGFLGQLPGKTPEATMASALYTDIKKGKGRNGAGSIFCR
jgi:error-prone DNA polymerase